MLVCSDLSLSSASAHSGGGEIKRFTREQLTVLTGRGGQTAASWVFFLFCFDVRPRSDLNPIKGLFVPPGTAEGNI